MRTIFSRGRFFLLLAIGVTGPGMEPARAQTTDTEVTEKTVLSDDLWVSPRAGGMAGALSPVADAMDAPWYNPAGIGGIHRKKGWKSTIRLLEFPYMGVAFNDNARDLISDFKQPGAGSDPMVTSAVLDANQGKRQYARFSFVPAIVMGRFMATYIYDNQLAAVTRGAGTGQIALRQRATSGPGFGFSATDPKGRFYLGAFTASLDRQELAGDFTFNEVNDPELRKDAIRGKTTNYQGVTSNVGILWVMSPRGRPSLGIVARDVGDTVYTKRNGAGDDTRVVKENLAASFAVSPGLGKWGFFSFVLEADQLGDQDTALKKKLRTGMEFSVGSVFGAGSGFALQTGYNAAGASGGARVNIGLIGLHLSTWGEDVGIENNSVIERRASAVISINVAE